MNQKFIHIFYFNLLYLIFCSFFISKLRFLSVHDINLVVSKFLKVHCLFMSENILYTRSFFRQSMQAQMT